MATVFRYHTGDPVKGGFYLNRRTWEMEVVNRAGHLGGQPDDTFVRVPMLLVLMLAPFAGALFAIFLPFIGIAMVLDLGVRRVLRRVGLTVRAGRRAEARRRA